MTAAEQKAAAKKFAAQWAGRGDEKSDTQSFWISLLRDVYGMQDTDNQLEFEKRVMLSNTSFIDLYIKPTQVMVEQKSIDKDLNKPIKQSDGTLLKPIQQLQRYAGALGKQLYPRWAVTCNFEQFHIYDMNHPQAEPEILHLADLPKETYRLNFLTDTGSDQLKREMEVSIAAGDIVGLLYDAFAKQYVDPTSDRAQKSLNVLCVRLVFCLYAEDAGLFGHHGMFHDYLAAYDARHMRGALIDLFKVLDTPVAARDPYLDPDLAAFPYVNGGLFADESIEIPTFTDEIRDLILSKASEDFNWSEISPTIFGAVFESTLNPDTRRKGGMHYTSIENIHKVIDPLFLDDLKAELAEILARPVHDSWRNRMLTAFESKLASLTFLDPACGSGNFLTETYLSLRRLENKVIAEQWKGTLGQTALQGWDAEHVGIEVSISHFYGIEINDFAVTVAKTALWIAESQMMKETEEIVSLPLDFLPLKTNAYIIEGNALRTDWESVVPKSKLNYIMGNPPFVGYTFQSKEQKDDLQRIMPSFSKNIDYVAGWYYKAAKLMQGTPIRTALVSTNSITQGEQVASIWKPLCNDLGVHIDFAYRTFRWDSEANQKAHVHCVIVGFSASPNTAKRKIYDGERFQIAENISPYLVSSPTIFIEKRTAPICDVPNMCKGSQPTDGGNFIFDTKEEVESLIQNEPLAAKYIHPFIGADEFINGKVRYCLWLANANPADIKKCPTIIKRIEGVREMRLNSTKAATRKCADTPTLFTENRQPNNDYILVPSVSSEKRRYVPIGFVNANTIASNLALIIPNITLYHFGVLTSNVHMAWMRTVCGRLKSDYRYSNTLVYNNFPWPAPTPEQKAKIEQTAQAVLDARALYPDSSLADLYDELTMPPELRKAHQANDRAVMDAYGFTKGHPARTSESACVAELMKLYQQLTAQGK